MIFVKVNLSKCVYIYVCVCIYYVGYEIMRLLFILQHNIFKSNLVLGRSLLYKQKIYSDVLSFIDYQKKIEYPVCLMEIKVGC